MYIPEISTKTIHSKQEDHGLILRDTLNAAINAIQATVLQQLDNLETPFRLTEGERQMVALWTTREFHNRIETVLFGRIGVMEESWGKYNPNL